ncbi:hypothetical protein ASPCAL12762 [Aspergillus calidoustus]|uniref:Uncharacterized protein n=1 Tax=Aspergillus calidoustus TaxID=454130 RepID=A0A0U5GEX7_ASPCI|nr:hypothetical protein ASPCAL12762 [Aspergillus calidoustus]
MPALTMGLAISATVTVGPIYWAQAFVVSIITPWDMDNVFSVRTLMLSNVMPRVPQGLPASLVITMVNYSISFGLGSLGSLSRD